MTPFGPEQGGGGGVYTQSVIALLRAAFGETAVDLIAPAPRETHSPWLERAFCVAASAFSDYPAKALFSRRSGLDRAAGTYGDRLDGRILVVNGAESYWFADAYGGAAAKRVLICHNMESALYREQIDTMALAARLVLRTLLRDDEKLGVLERRAFAQSDLIICISSVDAEAIADRYGAARTHHLPPAFAYPPFGDKWQEPAAGAPLKLGFIAKFSWWPNADAAGWLAQEILPKLPGDRELHLFGLGSESYHAPGKRIFGHGFVRDLSDIWRACDIVLCPMRAGGGVNVKFAEALYNRMPVCATPLAARGLGIEARDTAGLRFLEGEGAWVAFLADDAARAFASLRPGEALGARFALAEQVAPLKAAFERAVFA